MLTGITISNTNTINICCIEVIWLWMRMNSIRWSLLISCNSTTYLRVADTVGGELDWLTVTSWWWFWSSTCSYSILVIFSKSRWTFLCRVRHVEVGYPHPSSSRVTQWFHMTIDMTRMSISISYEVIVR